MKAVDIVDRLLEQEESYAILTLTEPPRWISGFSTLQAAHDYTVSEQLLGSVIHDMDSGRKWQVNTDYKLRTDETPDDMDLDMDAHHADGSTIS